MTDETMILKKLNALKRNEFMKVIITLLERLGYGGCSEYYPNGIFTNRCFIHANLPILGFEENASAISVIFQLFQRDVEVMDAEPLIKFVEDDNMPSEIGIFLTTGKITGGVAALTVMPFHSHRFMLIEGDELMKLILKYGIEPEDCVIGD
jgi:restriction endonuclease Mrr